MSDKRIVVTLEIDELKLEWSLQNSNWECVSIDPLGGWLREYAHDCNSYPEVMALIMGLLADADA